MDKVLYMIFIGASFNFGKFIFDHNVQHAQSHVVLKLIAYSSSLLCCIMESQHLEILTVADEEAPSPGFITISPKLLHGTHVADIPLRAVETSDASGPRNDETASFIRDEIRQLEGVI
ncbi:hypothetical protein LIER_35648 [Lithospermum erythrorhizon]|uniref:Uncharacterized protein n=1 Tax=Lithospermum erythrorhizon TaxID=34254 RepID=A0AAV3NVA0_LITER